MRAIKASLFYLLNLCVLVVLLLFFIDLNIYQAAIATASSFMNTHLSLISKKNVALCGLFCYLLLMVLDIRELSKADRIAGEKNALYKRALISKPISGVTIYYLLTQGDKIRQGLLSVPVIKLLYALRLMTFALLLLFGALLFISFHDLYLLGFIAMILFTLIAHYLFEVAILTDVLQRVPDIAGSPYSKYFEAIQPLFAYREYYVKEVKARKP
jgi:hypothetical protein